MDIDVEDYKRLVKKVENEEELTGDEAERVSNYVIKIYSIQIARRFLLYGVLIGIVICVIIFYGMAASKWINLC